MVLVANTKQPVTIQHKKRTGDHHKRSGSYDKPYWPYLPLVGIVALGLIVNTFFTHHGSVLGANTTMSISTLLSDTNGQRNSNNERALADNAALNQAAQAKANDMVQKNYWSHNSPDGVTPWSFITKAGYNYQAAGENLAYGFTSSEAVINGWMQSQEHRANILNANYIDVGFGMATSNNYQNNGPEVVVVAMYADPVTVTTAGSNTKSTVDAIASSVGVTSPARTNTTQPPSQRIARVQILTATSASWSVFIVSSLSALFVLWFLIRHSVAWHRFLVKSEAFVLHHRAIDLGIVIFVMATFILTRTAGFIR